VELTGTPQNREIKLTKLMAIPVWRAEVPCGAAADVVGYFEYRSVSVDLIRFGGHLPKGGYDVQTNGRQSQAAAQAPAVRF
jgi:hypothetical protein